MHFYIFLNVDAFYLKSTIKADKYNIIWSAVSILISLYSSTDED